MCSLPLYIPSGHMSSSLPRCAEYKTLPNPYAIGLNRRNYDSVPLLKHLRGGSYIQHTSVVPIIACPGCGTDTQECDGVCSQCWSQMIVRPCSLCRKTVTLPNQREVRARCRLGWFWLPDVYSTCTACAATPAHDREANNDNALERH